MIVQVCIGSSCHIKGSHDIVEMLKSEVELRKLEDDVVLAGSFCTGHCNREGVTITVDDEVVTGVTTENFKEFFEEKIIKGIEKERSNF